MNTWTLLIVLAASVLAILLLYSAAPYQRSLRRPLAAFPARVSAGLVAIIALRGWIEALGMAAGMLVWLASVGAVAALDYWLHSWNAR